MNVLVRVESSKLKFRLNYDKKYANIHKLYSCLLLMDGNTLEELTDSLSFKDD